MENINSNSPITTFPENPESVHSPSVTPGPPPSSPVTPIRLDAKIRNNITKRDIRRLGRKAGIKRLTGDVVDEARNSLVDFLTTIIKDSATYSDYASRKTVTKNDIMYSLKKNGRTLYN
jgi:histone H4